MSVTTVMTVMTVLTVMILLLGSYNFFCSISTTTAINAHKSSTMTDIFFVPEYTEDLSPPLPLLLLYKR